MLGAKTSRASATGGQTSAKRRAAFAGVSSLVRKELEALGMGDVACCRASGNVVFSAREADEAKLIGRMESGLGEALGYEVPVYLRGDDELRGIAEHEPFKPGVLKTSKGKLQIAFMSSAPKPRARKQALALSTDDGRLAIDGRQLYWLPKGGLRNHDQDQGHGRADRCEVLRGMTIDGRAVDRSDG